MVHGGKPHWSLFVCDLGVLIGVFFAYMACGQLYWSPCQLSIRHIPAMIEVHKNLVCCSKTEIIGSHCRWACVICCCFYGQLGRFWAYDSLWIWIFGWRTKLTVKCYILVLHVFKPNSVYCISSEIFSGDRVGTVLYCLDVMLFNELHRVTEHGWHLLMFEKKLSRICEDKSMLEMLNQTYVLINLTVMKLQQSCH